MLAEGYQGGATLTENPQRFPIQLGVEMSGGYRSDYVWRGWEMSPHVWETQLATSLSLSNNWVLGVEFDSMSSFAHSDFSQITLASECLYYLSSELTAGPTVAGQWYDDCLFNNAAELGGIIRWVPSKSWSSQASFLYDSGQQGWYEQISITWQPLISERIAVPTTLSFGACNDYLGTNGPHELMLRTGLLIRVSPSFKIQPFIAYSLGIRDQNTRCLYGGCRVIFQF